VFKQRYSAPSTQRGRVALSFQRRIAVERRIHSRIGRIETLNR
jgi:hypothetical protein